MPLCGENASVQHVSALRGGEQASNRVEREPSTPAAGMTITPAASPNAAISSQTKRTRSAPQLQCEALRHARRNTLIVRHPSKAVEQPPDVSTRSTGGTRGEDRIGDDVGGVAGVVGYLRGSCRQPPRPSGTMQITRQARAVERGIALVIGRPFFL